MVEQLILSVVIALIIVLMVGTVVGVISIILTELDDLKTLLPLGGFILLVLAVFLNL